MVSNVFYFHPIHGEMIQFDKHIFQWEDPSNKEPQHLLVFLDGELQNGMWSNCDVGQFCNWCNLVSRPGMLDGIFYLKFGRFCLKCVESVVEIVAEENFDVIQLCCVCVRLIFQDFVTPHARNMFSWYYILFKTDADACTQTVFFVL